MNESKNEKPRVIVVGSNYGSILTMVRDLAAADYPVSVLRVFKHRPSPANLLGRMIPESKSIYVSDFRTCIMKGDPANLCDSLLAMAADASPGEEPEEAPSAAPVHTKPLLVPVEDFLVSAVDSCYDQLSEKFTLQHIGREQNGINKYMDKVLQKELAKECGIPVLFSRAIYTEDVPADISYPCFVKPAVSKDGSKLKMVKCQDPEELSDALASYAKAGAVNVLAEAFVNVKDEYAMVGFATPERTVIPGVFRTSVPGHRERKGVAVMGEVTYKKGLEELTGACEEFVSRMGYVGMFDLDFIETTDGDLYFIEMNFRAGASEHVFTHAGVNIPGTFADALLSGQIPSKCKADIGSQHLFVSEKALLEEYVRNDMTFRKFNQCLRQANVFFIKNEKDPEPYHYFSKYVKIARYLRVLYRVRDSRR